jgi:RHS repeat-associated protein
MPTRIIAAGTVYLLTLCLAQGKTEPKNSPTQPGPIPQNTAAHVDISVIPPYPTDAIVRAAAPIKLPGGGGVTDTGRPTYNLPLWTPDGPGGLKPQLAIRYGGRTTTNGSLGVGMAIEGLSVITPCRQTIASEGRAAGIRFDREDSYCLDDQKLVKDWTSIADVPGSIPQPNGSNGIQFTYHTEIETFQRIVATYADNDAKKHPQPESFTVWRRDGLIATYMPRKAHRAKEPEKDPSRYDQSHQEPSFQEEQVAVVYPITSLVDRAGNRLEYDYEEDKDPAAPHDPDPAAPYLFSYRISKISYSFSDEIPRRWIHFSYRPRSDVITANLSGVMSITRSVLSGIEAYAPNPVSTECVWSYQLGYTVSADTKRSLLDSVQLFDQFGMHSWARRFEWTNPYAGYHEKTVSADQEFDDESLSRDVKSISDYIAPTMPGMERFNFLEPKDTQLLLFDVDGDGIDDVLYRTKQSRFLIQFHFGPAPDGSYFADGLVPGQIWLRRSKDGDPLGERTDVTLLFEPNPAGIPTVDGVRQPPPPSDWVAHLGKSRVADLDGDGVLDLLVARTKVERVGQWPKPTTPPEDGLILDANFHVDKWSFGYTNFGAWPWNPEKSDQLDDVSIFGPVIHAEGSGVYNRLFTPSFQRTLADLDGDGRVEVIDAFSESFGTAVDLNQHTEDEWLHLADYNPHFPYITRLTTNNAKYSLSQSWICNNGRMRITDLDGDGRDDVLAASNDDIDAYGPGAAGGIYKRLYIDQNGIPAAKDIAKLWAGDCNQYDPDVVMADFNGDGLPDALYPPHTLVTPTAPNGNPEPKIRWNLGNGFGPLVTMPVVGAPGLNELLYQPVPSGKDGNPVAWDRGTRIADVNGDGRADIIAFRLQTSHPCLGTIGPPAPGALTNIFFCSNYQTVVVLYLSAGDHFEAQVIKTWDNGGISLAQGFTTAQLGDVTGDGAVDIVHVVDGKIHVLELPWRHQPDLLRFVKDDGSYYPLEVFEYTREWWGGQPRPAPLSPSPQPIDPHACAYPISCHQRGFTVVQQHAVFAGTREDGKSMYHNSWHTYGEPHSDLMGRGFLGFKVHRIWDEGLGQETVIQFGDPTPVDLAPQSAGGIFYPFVGLPFTTTTITPIAPLPNQAELDAYVAMPGLMNQSTVKARISQTTRTYEVKDVFAGHVISIRPKTFSTLEYETQANVETNKATPSFTSWNNGPIEGSISRSGSYDYDDFGNVTHEVTETEGGVHQETWHEYENRVEPDPYIDPSVNPTAYALHSWLIGLRTKTETISYRKAKPDPSIQTVKGPVARVLRASYDGRGLLKNVRTSGKGPLFKYCVPPADDPEGCEEKGVETTFSRDGRGLVFQETSKAADGPQLRTTHYTYDPEGVYGVHVTDAAGFTTTTLIHPALGVPVLATDPLGVHTNLKYDGFGRLLEVTRPSAATVQQSYTEYIDNKRRGITAIQDAADGSQSSSTYDELGRPIRTTVRGFGGSSLVTRSEYNAFGFIERVSRPGLGSPASAESARTYDRLGRALYYKAPDGSTTTYEHHPFVSYAWDPTGHQTFTEYDVDGRVTQTGNYVGGKSKYVDDKWTDVDGAKYGKWIDVDGTKYGTVSFLYGDFNRVVRATDAKGNVTLLSYDALGRRVDLKDLDSGETQFKYNGFGELVYRKTADGAEITRKYDALGRVIHTTGPDGDTDFVWDNGLNAAHRLVSTTGTDLATGYEYNSLGLLKRLTRTIHGETYDVAQSYDSYSRVKYLFYPEVPGRPRFTLRYRYNGAGYLRAIEDVSLCGFPADRPFLDVELPNPCARELWSVLSRSNDLAVEDTLFGGTLQMTRKHDFVTGRIESISFPYSGYLLKYGYDDDGNVTSRIESGTNRYEKFGYDSLHRLTEWHVWFPLSRKNRENGEAINGPDRLYSYDELGNLYSVAYPPIGVGGSGLQVAGPLEFEATFGNQGKPHAIDWSNLGGAFHYDSCGRQVSGGGRNIAQYSQYDLPREIKTDTATTQFEFDEAGNRVRKVRTTDVETSTVYVGNLYERRSNSTGDLHVFYVNGDPGVVVQVIYSGAQRLIRYIVADGLGSPALILNENGSIVEKTYYDPFGGRVDLMGNPTNLPDPDPATTLGFTGHEQDDDGLLNMGGRIYDRAQYRFLTPDPIIPNPLFGQSYNRYSYVTNNPLRYTDPTGYAEDDQEQAQEAPNPTDTVGICPKTYNPQGETVCGATVINVIKQDQGNAPAIDPAPVKARNVSPADLKSWRPPLESVQHPKPWAPRAIFQEGLERTTHIALDRTKSWTVRALAAGGAMAFYQATEAETAVHDLIAVPQLAVTETIAAGEHGARALILSEKGSDTAVLDEYLAAVQSAAEGIANTAGTVAMVAGGATALSQNLLPQFAESTIDDVVASAARGRNPQITEGARAIAKKLGHAERSGYTSAFEGVPPTQGNAASLIRNIMSNPSRTFYGDRVIDIYNAAGQGVRIEFGTNRFIGFLEKSIATQ